ncbi:hypothetical protein U0070_014694 [Myodes glareolus]|uniref:Uncharacterized protein n=1 Tax=Myodes glareolus TaxID=447135 RepID=A0AAW0IUV1_MYOGA
MSQVPRYLQHAKQALYHRCYKGDPILGVWFIFLLAMVAKRLVKKTKAHVVIRLLGFFLLCFHFLLLSWGSSGGGGRTACWCGSGCWSRPTSPYIADEAPNVDIGQGLCKQARPERFNIDTSCL